MRVVSLQEAPAWTARAIAYFQDKWASEASRAVYDDSIRHTAMPLPQWYLLVDGADRIIGCAGLITNDFISRMDLYPWLCALYIEPTHRGRGYPRLLLEQAMQDARQGGFARLYLATDHIGYYERHGFAHIGTGHHPWGDASRIYAIDL